VDVALEIFYHLRRIGLDRNPTTRELLNWLKYVEGYAQEEAIDKIKNLDGIGVLVKTQDDLEKVQQRLFGDSELDYGKRSNFN